MSTVKAMVARIAAFSLAVFVGLTAAHAENTALEPKSDAEWKEVVNGGTVRILTKGLGCTCTAIASDMASVLNETGERRILPVLGHGSLQGIADIMYLQGVDLSILQADVLSYVKRNAIHRNIERRVRYVTKLYNSELHLIAGHGSKTIQDLDGKLVSYDVKGRGSFITAENVFQSLGIEVVPVHHERDVAIEKIRAGEIAAAFVVTGKPADSMRDVRPGNGLHLLPVPINSELSETYLPSTLTHDDYPNFIEEGETIETIAVPEVLAVYNWDPNSDRYEKVKSVVEAFFEDFDKFHDPVRHPKWKDVDLTAELPGWERFKPATDWLNRQVETAGTVKTVEAVEIVEPVDEEGFELSVGDRVIRVQGDTIKSIEKVEPVPLDDNEGQTVIARSYPSENEAEDDIRAIATSPLSISVVPTSTDEGGESLSFDISLSRPAVAEIPIVFNTIGGTAEPDVDFKRQNGVMIIEPGVTEAKLDIEIVDDKVKEGDEEFSLIMTIDPAIAELEQGPYKAVIRDND